MIPDAGFWRGKRVLLTGHTGFKGAWMSLWLAEMGAVVSGIALAPATNPCLYSLAQISSHIASRFCDIRDNELLADIVREFRPEVVFHLAAQALVRPSYVKPLDTITTNVVGTANLLNALRDLESVRAVVVVTTDKVYRNLEWPYPYREDDPLGGHDPYSASKAACELIVSSFRDSYLANQGVAVATARAGNVIGGGDWADDRLIPDLIRAWQADQPMHVRNPHAVRPWQHVLEPVCGYLVLAERLWQQSKLAGSYNFGPDTFEAITVRALLKKAQEVLGSAKVVWSDGEPGPHEAKWLALEIAKARSELGVQPRWSLDQAIERTIRWYVALAQGADAQVLCKADIAAYRSAQ